MEFIDKIYQFVLYLIKSIRGLVLSIKGEEEDVPPTIVDDRN